MCDWCVCGGGSGGRGGECEEKGIVLLRKHFFEIDLIILKGGDILSYHGTFFLCDILSYKGNIRKVP